MTGADNYQSAAPVRRAMQEVAYKDDRKLAARQAMWRFVERPPPSRRGRVLGAVDLTGDEVVVDAGCGNGRDLADLARAGHRGPLIGIDLSIGMLDAVPINAAAARRVVGDVMAIPIATGAADVALAMHMLYHVADIAAAVGELRRIVRTDGGICLTSTNSATTMPELIEVWQRALSAAAGEPVPLTRDSMARFSLENAADLLGAAFDDVEIKRYDNRLRVPDAAVVRAYVESTRDLYSRFLPDPAAWDDAMDHLEAEVAGIIERDGVFTITTASGVIVSR